MVTPLPLPKWGSGAPKIFGPCLLWPNGWMDEAGTWHGGRPWSRPHCARWERSSPPQKGGKAPPIFGPFLLWPNGWMHQESRFKMPLCMQVGLSPGDFVFYGDPAIPRKKGHSHPTPFLAHVYCGQTAGWMKMPLGTEVDLGPGNFVSDGFPAIHERGTAAPSFRPMSVVATVAHLSYC